MTNFNKVLVGLATLVVIIGLGIHFAPSTSVGGTVENYPVWFFNGLNGGTTKQFSVSSSGKITTSGGVLNTGTSQVGTNGSVVSQTANGICNLIGTPTVTATTTIPIDCAASGVVAGDRIFFTAPTTTVETFQGWNLVYANASSTSGYITFGLKNLTGATAVPTSATTSSIQYLDIR